jgi:hypothetical protein
MSFQEEVAALKARIAAGQSVLGGEAALPVPAAPGAHATDALQRELMAEFAITFGANAYHLGPYRYTMLDDAVKCARLLRMQGREVDQLE